MRGPRAEVFKITSGVHLPSVLLFGQRSGTSPLLFLSLLDDTGRQRVFTGHQLALDVRGPYRLCVACYTIPQFSYNYHNWCVPTHGDHRAGCGCLRKR